MLEDLQKEIQKIEISTSIKKISLSENERLIFNKAYDLLSRREYSKIELSKKLANKFPDKSHLISELIIKLEESGYLSEARYKEMIIKKLLKKGSSHRAISNELSLHNIHTSNSEIDEWQYSLGLSKKESINSLIQKKLRLIPNKALQKKRESIIRFLLSKGYTYEEIKPSIEDSLKDHF